MARTTAAVERERAYPLAWAILNDLHGDLHRDDSVDAIEALRRREKTGREFLFGECDEKFWAEDLNERGNAFAAWYYGEGANAGAYLDDYEQALCGDLPSLW